MDWPKEKKLNRITAFRGWYLPASDAETGKISLTVNGRTVCSLAPALRADVAEAFPAAPQALFAGFFGELLLPETIKPGDAVEVTLQAEQKNGKREVFARDTYSYSGEITPRRAPVRKNYSIEKLLWQPRFHFQKIENAYHSFPAGTEPVFRLLLNQETHPYSPLALEVTENARGTVLDFGAGNPPREFLRENVLYLDGIHYPHTDVVNGHLVLPLKADSFSGIISQAVLEHVPDPFAMVREFLRVLKPGGRVLIDTAFMQPLHADPGHYFNMTEQGLREIMRGFEIEKIGSQPHQQPSFGLQMQMEHVLPVMQAGKWKERFSVLLEDLRGEGAALNECLGERGRQILAAGVFVLARKPRRGFRGWTR